MTLISQQGIRPGSINMGRILRNLRHHSDMSRKVVYHRLPIFKKDDYGVETGETSTNELLLPNLPALIRPALTADYTLERGGANIIGAARVYTPNMQTIKGFSNFDQDNNTNFNEIEGWDRFIDTSRIIYHIPTNVATGWSANEAVTSDGEKVTFTSDGEASQTLEFDVSATNTLEADRFRFQIKASGVAKFEQFDLSQTDILTYTPASAVLIPTDSWLTVDVPFERKTQELFASGTSIYQDGVRTAVTLSAFTEEQYEDPFTKLTLYFEDTVAEDVEVYMKGIQYYKSISWHVHSVKEINEQFIIFNTVRTRGKRDSIRRSYG